MKKIGLVALVLMLFSISMLGTQLVVTVGGSTTHHVYPGQSIQAAINSAQPDDTIFVHAGTYYENVIVNKTVSLIGENKHTTIIDGGAAQFDVVYVSAHNVTINSFALQRGGRGIYPDRRGIYVYSSNNINISNNVIRENVEGIFICVSNDNVVRNNSVHANTKNGLWLYGSSNNVITYNTIANNGEFGMVLQGTCSNNLIFHNNFINDENHHIATTGESGNVWDDGYPSGGNYWSDYNGTDANQDGLGDTAYIIDVNNQDNYPLMGRYYDFPISNIVGHELEETFQISIICNSTGTGSGVLCPIINLETGEWGGGEYILEVTGSEGTKGFCRFTIPKNLLSSGQGSWIVYVDRIKVTSSCNIWDNSTHTFIYVPYNHSTLEITIFGWWIVPELPTWTTILLILIVLTVTVVIYKRRLLKTPIH